MRDNRHMWCRSKFSKVNFVAIFPSTFRNELIFENIFTGDTARAVEATVQKELVEILKSQFAIPVAM